MRPVPLLLTLAAVELATVAWLAFDTPHNGWVWHSGGDATEYWTAQWSVAHGFVPQAVISYGLPVFYGWVPLVTGTTLLHGLPVIVPLQALVLVPLVLVLVWAVADQLYGRVYAAVAAAIWAFGPLLMMLAVADRYRPSFEQYFLAPHWAGLTNMADLPSVAAVLATMWAALRARRLRTRRPGAPRGRVRGGRDRDQAGQRVLRPRARRPLRGGAAAPARARLRGRPRAGAADADRLEVERARAPAHHLGVRRDARGGGRPGRGEHVELRAARLPPPEARVP